MGYRNGIERRSICGGRGSLHRPLVLFHEAKHLGSARLLPKVRILVLKVEVLITGSGRHGQEVALKLLNPMLELQRPAWIIFRVR